MLRSAAAVLALAALGTPAVAGEFFTGTRSESSRFDSARTSTGHESIDSFRQFDNEIKGSSHKHFVNVSATAENARMGSRRYGFAEGEAEIDGALIGLGSLGWTGGDLAAFGQRGIEVDGMAGTGHERYLDGSLDAAAEWGSARTEFKLQENGNTKYKMNGDFAEVTTEDGTRSSGGSVFSFN